jgi:RNA ligase (TIGR02306 family)
MSQFSVTVVRIPKVGKHPNADSLSICTLEGCPVIFRTGDFKEGDAAIYVPVEAVVPETVPGTEFLGKHRRIRAMRLRGVFSMGLLLPTTALPEQPVTGVGVSGYEPGENVAPLLGITKYEEPEPPTHMQTEAAPAPKTHQPVPVYDLESYRKYKHLLVPGETVVCTEKIHGSNSKFCYFQGELHVGSHHGWKKFDETNLWWKAALRYSLSEKLKAQPNLVFFAEVYGKVQDLRYGCGPNDYRLAFFDVFDTDLGIFYDYENNDSIVGGCPVDNLTSLCQQLDLPMAPVLYRGPYLPEVVEPLCDGDSLASTEKQIREGMVVRPIHERWNAETGRTVLKLVGEAYLLRRGKTTEFH